MSTDGERRVLFVDDAPEQVRLSTAYFDRAPDVSLVTAESADEALSTVREAEVDCLVSDGVRTEDGEPLVEAAKRARPDLPVVLYSGRPRADLPTDAADGYVRKATSSARGTSLELLDYEIRELTAASRATGGAPDGWTSLGRFDWTESESVPLAALEALADRTGIDLLDGRPMAETVDPEALDTLIRGGAATDGDGPRVRFRFAGYRVEVSADGTVRYRASAASGPG